MNKAEAAHHEAGHMVAAWELGLEVTLATVVPDPEEDYDGLVRVPFLKDRVLCASWVDEQEYLHAHLVTSLAGIEASERHTGTPMTDPEIAVHLEGPGSDYRSVAELVYGIAGPDLEMQDESYKAARRQAGLLMHSRWWMVEKVAAVLLERGTLDERECEELLGDLYGDL